MRRAGVVALLLAASAVLSGCGEDEAVEASDDRITAATIAGAQRFDRMKPRMQRAVCMAWRENQDPAAATIVIPAWLRADLSDDEAQAAAVTVVMGACEP